MAALVLLVEDNRDLADMTAGLLAMMGFAVIAIHGLPHPSALSLRGCPDVVVIDLMLSGSFDGIELARALHAADVTCPFVAVSASTHMLELAEASGEFAQCIAKPFEVLDLTACLQELVNHAD